MATVHIIPVGFSKEKLLESLKHYPFQKVYLLVGRDHLEMEEKVREIAQSMKRDLEAIVEVEEVEVDKEDVLEAARDIVKIINYEKAKGNEVMVNISGSMRTLAVASYIAASLTGAKVYSGISKYSEEGKPIGVQKTVDIPLFPIKRLSQKKEAILKVLYKSDGYASSLEEIIRRLKPELEPGSKEYNAERSLVSYHVNALKEEGFVETEKSGKNLIVRLSKLGEIYLLGLGKVDS
jgi:CRISPR-associated protein Csa3